MNLQAALEARALSTSLAVPSVAQRALAGRPVVIDGQTLHPEVQLILRLKKLSGTSSVESLPIAQGRRLMIRETRASGGRQPIGAVRDLRVAELPARLYTPKIGGDRAPLLVFFHGGGFVYGDLQSHDAPCRFLAERAGVRVLAVDYRLAPEHPFPAAHDDAVAAFGWVVEHLDELGVEPGRIAVGGDSAGANLATGVAIEAARRGWPLAFQLLVYPVTDQAAQTRSRELFAEGFYLNSSFIGLATSSYLGDSDLRDPRCSPLYADLPEGLAPAAVITAGFDPLRDEGEEYARALTDAGVEVRQKRFPDLFHGFFNVVGVGSRCREANAEIAAMLREGLA